MEFRIVFLLNNSKFFSLSKYFQILSLDLILDKYIFLSLKNKEICIIYLFNIIWKIKTFL